MARPEAAIETYLREQVEARGGLCEKFTPTRVGQPDRLVTWPYLPMDLVELKAPNGEVSDMQKRDHARRAKLGVFVFVLWTKAQVDKYISMRDLHSSMARSRAECR
jgi:hypothetical protein